MTLVITSEGCERPGERRIEIVERKGLGHPDSICDAVAEAFSIELSRFYLEHAGRILHHNVDKTMLAAGVSRPDFGGGTVVEPMRLLLAGRASADAGGVEVPIVELAQQTSRRWLEQNLRALDVSRHVEVSSLVRSGSSDLVELFDEGGRQRSPLSNDTSIGVGFAPLSDAERVVLAVEQRLTSGEAHRTEPAIGEDVKVMGVRDEGRIDLTISTAMIGAKLRDPADYARAKDVVAELALKATREASDLEASVAVNASDDPDTGRLYLTVTGTSAEAGDDGQTGRGNRANGLITPGRPMTMESVAGKNPVTHVGKLYNIAASLLAERIVASVEGVVGAECRLVSRIGAPIDEPRWVDLRLAGVSADRDAELREELERIVRDELARLPQLAEQLVQGTLRLDRWPLRA